MKQSFRWEIGCDSFTGEMTVEEIINVILKNRGITTVKERQEFFTPTHPVEITLKKVGVDFAAVKIAINRIKQAIREDEDAVIYGDYDADGICATAILWETLYAMNLKVRPYLPDRFSEGYGLNAESIEKLKQNNANLKLIITVDNGIVAHQAVQRANELGIDVIITDHHEKTDLLPEALAVIHTTQIAGAGLSWFFAREIRKNFSDDLHLLFGDGLELAAIGTIADQVPLLAANRSIAKYGLRDLNSSTRPGIKCLLREAGIKGLVGVYDIGFVLAPRINAMGRLNHALDSLRFLCTNSSEKALQLSTTLSRTNTERQKIVEEMVVHAKSSVLAHDWKGIIVLSHQSYHEGIIGLAASRIVEEFYRPVILISQGKEVSKASARSIPGFNIIENIRKLDSYILGGGGHPMAAGFSIETSKINDFIEEMEKVSTPLLSAEVLKKRLKIDLEIPSNLITSELSSKLKQFEPSGTGNPTPVFATKDVEILDAKLVGKDQRHLKLVIEKNRKTFDVIGFNFGFLFKDILPGVKADVAYTLEENEWNGRTTTQLKLKDLIFK